MERYLHQPKRLDSMSTDRLGDWMTSHANKIMSPIVELHPRDPTAAEAMLSQQIEMFRNYLECYVPSTIHDTVAAQAIRALAGLPREPEPYKPMWEREGRVTSLIYIKPNESLGQFEIGQSIETLFTKNLTCLSLQYDEILAFLPTICSKSHLLGGLTRLELSAGSGIDITQVQLIQLLRELHNLKYLSLKECQFTENILACIIENCQLIEELNLHGVHLNEKKTRTMTQLGNLKSITLSNGRVAREETTTLLLSFENIEFINSPDTNFDYIYHALVEIMSSEKHGGKRFNIQFFKVNISKTTQDLRVVVKMCPQIQKFEVSYKPRSYRTISQNHLRPLNDLQDLHELKLTGFDFYPDIIDVLLVRGCNLVTLHLWDISKMDSNAFINISQTCPNLQDFHVIECYFVNETSNNDVSLYKDTKLQIPPFRNVVRLDLKSFSRQLSEWILLFLLSNCVNVEFLTMETIALTDHIILSALDKNRLVCAKKIIMNYNYDDQLSKLVMDRIVQTWVSSPEVELSYTRPQFIRRVCGRKLRKVSLVP